MFPKKMPPECQMFSELQAYVVETPKYKPGDQVKLFIRDPWVIDKCRRLKYHYIGIVSL